MAIDFEELLEAIRQQPALRDELLSALLSARFLELPDRTGAIENVLVRLTERMDRLTERMDQLTERMDQLTERMDQLTEAQRRTEIALQRLTNRFATQLPKIDSAIGYVVEQRYHTRASAYFAPIARRIRVLSRDVLDDLLDDALERGAIAEDDARSIRLADTIASATRDGEPVHLVVEASYTIDEQGVSRALQRARQLGELVGSTIPVVAGEHIAPDAAALAAAEGVWQVLDDTVTAPSIAR